MARRPVVLSYSAILLLAACHIGKPVSITTANAPKAIGPYSQAVKTGKLIYTAGQIGLMPTTGTLAGDDIISQTHQVLKNIKAVLETSGSDMEHVIKTTVFLKNMDDFSRMNDVYKDYFPAMKPARSTVQVVKLPKDALIEIECIAATK